MAEQTGLLRNSRHERFCQEIAQGAAACRAYELAGYTPGPAAAKNAHRLMKNEGVMQRIQALQQAAAIQTGETIATITAELNEALRMARQQQRPKDMVTASMAKAKINGLIVDKQVTTLFSHEDALAALLAETDQTSDQPTCPETGARQP